MWIVTWVEMNDCLEYYPKFKIFKDYFEGKNYQSMLDDQRNDEELGCDSGSIISEIYISELEF